MANPTPEIENAMNINAKLGAKMHNKAEILKNKRPVWSNALCGKRILMTPMNKAPIAVIPDATVEICAIILIERSNVCAISIRRYPTRIAGDLVTKRAMTREGRVSLPGDCISEECR